MPRETANDQRSAVRRRDYWVRDPDWIRGFLAEASVGYLATLDGYQPFINSNLFTYDEAAHCIYLHTAGRGRTLDNVWSNSRVCFAVSSMGRLLPAEEALHFSAEHAGVVVFGSAEILHDRAEKRRALQTMMDKYFPDHLPVRDYRPIQDAELDATTVFRITVEEWRGKEKKVAEDFPGAFLYEAAEKVGAL